MSFAPIFAEWFGIAKGPATLLAELYEAGDRAVPHDYIAHRLGLTLPAIRNAIHLLHRGMEPGAVMALYGHGYRLSEIGRRECDAAIADARARGIPFTSAAGGVSGSDAGPRRERRVVA